MLLTLFGPGEIYDPYAAYPQLQGLINKSITLKSGSLIREHLKIDGFAFGLARYVDQVPVKTGASFGFTTSTPANPFLAELMKTNFGVGAQWYDPLGGFNAVATHENMDAAFRRPIKTHPKGYFRIDEINENERYISKLQIELNQNGTLRSARMNQKEK